MDCTVPGSPICYLPEFTQIHVHWIGDAIKPTHPLLPCSPFAFNHSQHQGLFQHVCSLHNGWSKYWSFSFSISPFNEYSGLISFRIDWFYLLAVQGTLKSHLQHHNWKASILWCSALFMVQLLQLYMSTGKTIALTIHTIVGKVINTSALYTLSRFVIAFLPRSKCLLISWLQSPQWFWSPRKENLSLFPLFPLLFAMKR